MFCYRVDKRSFKYDDIISPDTTFEEKMDDLQLEVEECLDRFKPSTVPDRRDCLYLFCKLSSAFLFCSKYGGFIYEVSVDVDDVYYKSDMNLLDIVYQVFALTKNEEIRAGAVRKYWEEGSHTFQPCYEILARQAVVKSILYNGEKDRAKIIYANIESSHIYREIMECRMNQ